MALLWFRKGLRLHDNPALASALSGAPSSIYPVFCLDPWFLKEENVGYNRIKFLIESLHDLDHNLRGLGSRLIVLRGNPHEELRCLMERCSIRSLSFERDTEPYAKERDAKMKQIATAMGVHVHDPVGHTLYDVDEVVSKSPGKRAPLTYEAFRKVLGKMGPPPAALPAPSTPLPPPLHIGDDEFPLPTGPEEFGYTTPPPSDITIFAGGETEALQRMTEFLAQKKRVAEFEKPNTAPTALPTAPSTTVLSPYLKFGCLSPRLFYHRLSDVLRTMPSHSQPPVSLVGQLLWREFFYTVGNKTPNFDKMVGNPICRQIPWQENPDHLAAWTEGRTGYPWIDACMIQLKKHGWMHHLARHAVACFLTRGDLWISWEAGWKVFDRLLIDADWSLNCGNWMWLSCSQFFHQYFRVYSPVAFPKKTDPSGTFVRHFIPKLRNFPDKYIYEPWKAPIDVQKKAGCIIGKDYPRPIVDHDIVSKANIQRMKLAFAAGQAGGAAAAATGKAEEEDDRSDEHIEKEEEEGANGASSSASAKRPRATKEAKSGDSKIAKKSK